jgi:hypothetical protein
MPKGFLRITQFVGAARQPKEFYRDYDAEEWSHQWVNLGGVQVLRLQHDKARTADESCELVEFSTPVTVEFIAVDP